jgi:hypothetical protein
VLAPSSRRILVVGLVLATSGAGPAVGHTSAALNVEVSAAEACEGEHSCLSRGEPALGLHAGDSVPFYAYNDDDRPHRLLVAVNASVEPTRAATSADRAIADSGSIEANGSRNAGEVAIPANAEALYVWCDRQNHEGAGERLVVALEAQQRTPESDRVPLGPGTGVVAIGVASALACGWRPRDRYTERLL